MKLYQKKRDTLTRLLDRFVMFFRQQHCWHVFLGPDLGARNESGVLDWPCSKCGKIYKFEYGLQALDHGQILGPWGTKRT